MPRVSVILNCYNHAPYVAEAVDSVLAQTFADFELILIDNGSTDGTRAVLERYHDPRIRRVFHDRNESLSKRLNEGVAAATGEFVCILYSDDKMLPDKLERQVAMFDALPPDTGVVYAPARVFNHFSKAEWTLPSAAIEGRLMPAILHLYAQGFPDMSSPLFRRACFTDHHWHEDLFSDGEAIHLRIGLDWKYRFDPVPTVELRDHDSNMGKAIQKNHDMLMTVCERLPSEPGFRPDYRRDLSAFVATVCRGNAWVALRVGTRDTGWVFRQLGRTLRERPSKALHPRWVGGALFALLPWSARDRLNRAARRLTGQASNTALVTDY